MFHQLLSPGFSRDLFPTDQQITDWRQLLSCFISGEHVSSLTGNKNQDPAPRLRNDAATDIRSLH